MAERRWSKVVGRTLIAMLLVLTAWGAWLMSGIWFRMLCGVGCIVFTGLAVAYVAGLARRSLVAVGLAVAVLAISPVEVAFGVRHGLPRVVPVLRGLPGPQGLERARRGEVVLAGCVITGFEPRWVLLL